MKKIFVGLTLTLAGISAHAVGPTGPITLTWCDSCTDAQMQQIATNVGYGDLIYVLNGPANIYHVYSMGIANGHLTALPASGYFTNNNVAAGLLSFYQAQPAGWHKSFLSNIHGNFEGTALSMSLPYSHPSINVYDVINAGPEQNYLTDWLLGAPGTLGNQVSNGLLNMASSFKLVDSSKLPTIEITVLFNDGSKITVKEDFSTTVAKATVDITSGRDSHNNNVPASKVAGVGSGVGMYNFSGPGNPTDSDSWRRQMGLFGYSFSGSGLQWACTVVAPVGGSGDAVYTCKAM